MATPRSVYVFLAVGVVAASQSGNLIRIGDASPVAVVAWRLLLASLIFLPLAWPDRQALLALPGRDRLVLLLAGVGLAAHLISWTAAVQHTTVANAAVFFAVNPVLVALGGFLIFGERFGLRFAVSLALGLGGVAVLGGGDLQLRPEQLAGNGYALLSAVFFAVYFLAGKQVRRSLPSGMHVLSVYGTAGLVSFGALVVLGLPVVTHSDRSWLCFVLMALIPTGIGHTALNHALRYVPVGRLSVVTLAEPLFAGAVAFVAWDEPITLQAGLGYLLVAASVAVLFTERSGPVAGAATALPAPRSPAG
jgi:drug/metabolite transporter (DMT)-like permease